MDIKKRSSKKELAEIFTNLDRVNAVLTDTLLHSDVCYGIHHRKIGGRWEVAIRALKEPPTRDDLAAAKLLYRADEVRAVRSISAQEVIEIK